MTRWTYLCPTRHMLPSWEHDEPPMSDAEAGLPEYLAEVEPMLPEWVDPIDHGIARMHLDDGDDPETCARDWVRYCEETS